MYSTGSKMDTSLLDPSPSRPYSPAPHVITWRDPTSTTHANPTARGGAEVGGEVGGGGGGGEGGSNVGGEGAGKGARAPAPCALAPALQPRRRS